MAATCFCGCGRRVRWGRRRIANALGDRVDRDVATFRGALERGPQGEHEAELRELVAEGAAMRETLRGIVHGTHDRRRYDKRAGRAWLRRAGRQRGRLAREVADYAGWDALGRSELVHAGRRAPAVVLGVDDTGVTINNDPRVRVRLRVAPAGEPPFEVERTVTVPRTALPRRGEPVEVAYDPGDRDRVTFRLAAGAGAPAPDRLAQLDLLGELRD
ncbi:MAG: hypothetical protein IRZ32_17905, partial [Solirubrobacteraceae bacterium]|nr:hypothetical protein [Solirubrobacteraceae bacterium]